MQLVIGNISKDHPAHGEPRHVAESDFCRTWMIFSQVFVVALVPDHRCRVLASCLPSHAQRHTTGLLPLALRPSMVSRKSNKAQWNACSGKRNLRDPRIFRLNNKFLPSPARPGMMTPPRQTAELTLREVAPGGAGARAKAPATLILLHLPRQARERSDKWTKDSLSELRTSWWTILQTMTALLLSHLHRPGRLLLDVDLRQGLLHKIAQANRCCHNSSDLKLRRFQRLSLHHTKDSGIH